MRQQTWIVTLLSCLAVAAGSPKALLARAHLSASLMDLSASPCKDFFTFACGGRGWLSLASKSQESDLEHMVSALRMRHNQTKKSIEPWQSTMLSYLDVCREHHASKQPVEGHSCMQTLRDYTRKLPSGNQSHLLLDLLLNEQPLQNISSDDVAAVFQLVGGGLHLSTLYSVITFNVQGKYRILVSGDTENGLFKDLRSSHNQSDRSRARSKVLEKAQRIVLSCDGSPDRLNNLDLQSRLQLLADDAVELDAIRAMAYFTTLREVSKYMQKYSLRKMQVKFPETGLSGCLKGVYPTHLRDNPSAQVVVLNGAYLEDLNARLSSLANDVGRSQFNRKMLNYLTWIVLNEFESYLTPKPMQEAPRVNNHIGGLSPCLQHLSKDMKVAVMALYVQSFTEESGRLQAEKLFGQLKAEISEGVHQLTWMTDPDKRVLVDLINNAMVGRLGYPQEARNSTYLNEEFGDLVFVNFFSAALALRPNTAREQQRLLELGAYNPTALAHWTSGELAPLWTSRVTTSPYHPSEFILPAGAIRPEEASPQLPPVLVYGGLGGKLAKAILSRMWLATQTDPRLRNSGLTARLDRQHDCIASQALRNFNSWPPDVDPKSNWFKPLVSEILQRDAALNYAWSAFKRHQTDRSAQGVPGFERATTEQLFLQAFVQSQCESEGDWNPEEWNYSIKFSVAQGSVLASVGLLTTRFRDAFQCRPRPTSILAIELATCHNLTAWHHLC